MDHVRRIGFIGFDGVTLLDLLGPLEVFSAANLLNESRSRLYQTVVIGATPSPITSDSGVIILPQVTFANAGEFDTLVVPGGPGLREPHINGTVAQWLHGRAHRTRRLVSICTGLYGLAATGLLDGREAATHWRYAASAARAFPNVRIDDAQLYHEDPPFFTSAGITAGIDLALALVEHDHGAPLALEVARELVVYFKRPGDQLQFSDPLKFQVRSVGRLEKLAAWLPDHLAQNLSIEALAARAGMGARHLTREFKRNFGMTPARYIERLRLERARERLHHGELTIDAVAYSVGFRSSDVFRRAFERRFGLAPSDYAKAFGASQAIKPAPNIRGRRPDFASEST